MRAIRALLGKSSDGANRLPVVAPAVAGLVKAVRIEEQSPREAGIVQSARREPVVAMRAEAEEEGAGAVSCSGKENALGRIRPFARHQSAVHTVARCPRRRAVADER